MTRLQLPARRAAETFTVEHGPGRFSVTIGRFGIGTIAEVFVSGGKSGSDTSAVVRDAAILISLALQHGCTVEGLRHSMSRNPDSTPQSIIGAVLDALTREEAHEPGAQ